MTAQHSQTRATGAPVRGWGWLLAGLLLPGLAACEFKPPEPPPPLRPTAEQLQQARHTGYQTPVGRKQECLARLVFDVPQGLNLQWGVNAPGLASGNRFRFTTDMHGGQDRVALGNVQVVVMAPATWEQLEGMSRYPVYDQRAAIRHYKESIEVKRDVIADLQSVLDDPSKNENGEDTSNFPRSIERIKAEIADAEASIAAIQREWKPIDWGLPQSLGYAAGSTFYAFFWRDGRAYQFMSAAGEGDPPRAERERAFREMLRNFRPRALYDVPKERGVCFPYGFVADDGQGHAHVEVSLRFADHPGVIYTVASSIVGEQGTEGSEQALLQATARAATGVLAGPLTAGRAARSLGPRQVKIGALPAWQGGIDMNVSDPGQPAVRSYSVYTGVGGWAHSRVLPNISVNMRSFTQEQEPTLGADPPPFDASLARLDSLIQSIRLRPTQQAMPELEPAPK